MSEHKKGTTLSNNERLAPPPTQTKRNAGQGTTTCYYSISKPDPYPDYPVEPPIEILLELGLRVMTSVPADLEKP